MKIIINCEHCGLKDVELTTKDGKRPSWYVLCDDCKKIKQPKHKLQEEAEMYIKKNKPQKKEKVMRHRQCKFCKNSLSWEWNDFHKHLRIGRTSHCKHCGWREIKEILKEKYEN